MYTFEPLVREDYHKVFIHEIHTTTPGDAVQLQLNAPYKPVGIICKDKKGNIIGSLVIYEYGIKEELLEIPSIIRVRPKGPFKIIVWVDEKYRCGYGLRDKLMEQSMRLHTRGETALFDITPYHKDKRKEAIARKWYLRDKNKWSFEKDGRIYMKSHPDDVLEE